MDPGYVMIGLMGGIAIALILWNILTMKISTEKLTPESKLHAVTFREDYASGRSMESMLTRMVWARYKLKVYVTSEFVRIIPRQSYRDTIRFSYNSSMKFTYMNLEIPLNKIFGVSVVTTAWGRKSLVLRYLESDMRVQELELVLRRRQEFIAAVRGWPR